MHEPSGRSRDRHPGAGRAIHRKDRPAQQQPREPGEAQPRRQMHEEIRNLEIERIEAVEIMIQGKARHADRALQRPGVPAPGGAPELLGA